MVSSAYSSFWQQISPKRQMMVRLMVTTRKVVIIVKKPKWFGNCWQVIWRFMSSMLVSLYWVNTKTSWRFYLGPPFLLCLYLTSLTAKMPILMTGRPCWQDAICTSQHALIRWRLSLRMKCAYGKTSPPCSLTLSDLSN